LLPVLGYDHNWNGLQVNHHKSIQSALTQFICECYPILKYVYYYNVNMWYKYFSLPKCEMYGCMDCINTCTAVCI